MSKCTEEAVTMRSKAVKRHAKADERQKMQIEKTSVAAEREHFPGTIEQSKKVCIAGTWGNYVSKLRI